MDCVAGGVASHTKATGGAMKITLLQNTTKQPFANRAVLVNVKDGQSGQIIDILTLRTTQDGSVELDQKYQGKQISVSVNGLQSSWIAAKDSAKLEVTSPSTSTTSTFSTTSATNTKSQNTQTTQKPKQKQPQ